MYRAFFIICKSTKEITILINIFKLLGVPKHVGE
jgi:hypothetical protein